MVDNGMHFVANKGIGNMPVTVEHQSFGPWLRSKRLARNLKQPALANLSGVSQAHISGLENGVKKPTIEICRKLAAPLGVTEREILLIAGFNPETDVKRQIAAAEARKKRINRLVDDLPVAGQESALRMMMELHAAYHPNARDENDSAPTN